MCETQKGPGQKLSDLIDHCKKGTLLVFMGGTSSRWSSREKEPGTSKDKQNARKGERASSSTKKKVKYECRLGGKWKDPVHFKNEGRDHRRHEMKARNKTRMTVVGRPARRRSPGKGGQNKN